MTAPIHKINVLESYKTAAFFPRTWFDKLLLWVARKRGYDMDVTKYKSIVIDTSKMFENIMQHANDVYTMTGKRPEYLFCGNDFFQTFASEALPNMHRIDFSPDGKDMRYAGMTVIIIPYIEGWFITPTLYGMG